VKPGDLIEWVYTTNKQVVEPFEKVWSSTMAQWVTVVGLNLLISHVHGVLTWMNDGRLFHARRDDGGTGRPLSLEVTVEPRSAQIAT